MVLSMFSKTVLNNSFQKHEPNAPLVSLPTTLALACNILVLTYIFFPRFHVIFPQLPNLYEPLEINLYCR